MRRRVGHQPDQWIDEGPASAQQGAWYRGALVQGDPGSYPALARRWAAEAAKRRARKAEDKAA